MLDDSFAASKSGLRAICQVGCSRYKCRLSRLTPCRLLQSVAREFGPQVSCPELCLNVALLTSSTLQNIHVAHIIVDGVIESQTMLDRFDFPKGSRFPDGAVSLASGGSPQASCSRRPPHAGSALARDGEDVALPRSAAAEVSEARGGERVVAHSAHPQQRMDVRDGPAPSQGALLTETEHTHHEQGTSQSCNFHEAQTVTAEANASGTQRRHAPSAKCDESELLVEAARRQRACGQIEVVLTFDGRIGK